MNVPFFSHELAIPVVPESLLTRERQIETSDITLHLSERLLSKRQQITIASEDVGKREPLLTVGRNANLCKHYGKQ